MMLCSGRALQAPVAGSAVSCYHSHERHAYLHQSLETCVLSWYKWMRTPGPYSLYTYTLQNEYLEIRPTAVRRVEEPVPGSDTAMLSELSCSGPPSRLTSHRHRVSPAGHRSKYSPGTSPHSSLRVVQDIYSWTLSHPSHFDPEDRGSMYSRNVGIYPYPHGTKPNTDNHCVSVWSAFNGRRWGKKTRRHREMQATRQDDTTAHKKCGWRSFVQWKSQSGTYGRVFNLNN
jgi:hypothetical protein